MGNLHSDRAKLTLLLALVSREKGRQANVPMRGGHYSVPAALCITVTVYWWPVSGRAVVPELKPI